MIQAHTIQKRDGDFEACAIVEMPCGAVPFMVIPHGEGMAIVAHSDPVMPSIVHPLFIMEAGVQVALPLGETIGAFLGYLHLGDKIAYVFQGSPWPTTALAAPAKGNG